ncbi:hypothetical protein PENSPDRAFT_757378 [Peniophora sp. CONT]|nr:hypothetical protein PENSPDRAFT_757378 [Peniophora sp. CONT]
MLNPTGRRIQLTSSYITTIMLSRLLIVFVAAASLISAAPQTSGAAPPAGNTCSTGEAAEALCCNFFNPAYVFRLPSDPFSNPIYDMGPDETVTISIATGCTPISAPASDGNSCKKQAVCCEDVRSNGVYGLECTRL